MLTHSVTLLDPLDEIVGEQPTSPVAGPQLTSPRATMSVVGTTEGKIGLRTSPTGPDLNRLAEVLAEVLAVREAGALTCGPARWAANAGAAASRDAAAASTAPPARTVIAPEP